MKHIIYFMAMLTGMIASSQAMEHRKQPLSLKYQCAKAAINSLRSAQNQEQNRSALEVLPVEVQEYASEFEHLEPAIEKLLATLEEQGSNPIRLQEIYHSLHATFSDLLDQNHYKSEDRSSLPYMLQTDSIKKPTEQFVALLDHLNNDDYTRDEKLSILLSLISNKDKFIKEDRLAFTHLLQKAIKLNHQVLIAFLSRKGAYILQQISDESNPNIDDESVHCYAFRLGNIEAIKILIASREYRASLKTPDKQKVSMEKFFDDWPAETPSTTPLSIALAVGHCELLKIYIEAIKRNNLDLYKYMLCEEPDGDTALYYAVAPSFNRVCFKSFSTLHGENAAYDTQKILETVRYFLSVAQQEGYNLLDFLHLFNGKERALAELAVENQQFFDMLFDVIVPFGVNMEQLLTPVLNSLLKDSRSEPLTKSMRSDYQRAIQCIISCANKHNIVINSMDYLLKNAILAHDFDMVEYFITRGWLTNLDQFLNATNSEDDPLVLQVVKRRLWKSHKLLKRLVAFANQHSVALVGLPQAFEMAKTFGKIKLLAMFDKLGIQSIDFNAYIHEQDASNDTVLLRLAKKSAVYGIKSLITIAQKYQLELPQVFEALTLMRDTLCIGGGKDQERMGILALLMPWCKNLDIAAFINTPNGDNQTLIARLMLMYNGNIEGAGIVALRTLLQRYGFFLYQDSNQQLRFGNMDDQEFQRQVAKTLSQ